MIMRDMTKQFIRELVHSIDYLALYEPWLSLKAIKDEIQGYYDCTDAELAKALKIHNNNNH